MTGARSNLHRAGSQDCQLLLQAVLDLAQLLLVAGLECSSLQCTKAHMQTFALQMTQCARWHVPSREWHIRSLSLLLLAAVGMAMLDLVTGMQAAC